MTCSKCSNKAEWLLDELETGKVYASCNQCLAFLVSEMRAFVGSRTGNEGLEAKRKEDELVKTNAG